MLNRNSLFAPLTALALLTPVGCSKTVGDALRPDDHTGASAVGAELDCAGPTGRIKPLVVDWDPDARVDLEAAMQGSVVVVKYNCPNVEILPGCTVDGSYTYAGVSRKEQVIQMQNMDDVHANIPISSAKVGVEIQSGRAIDLATVLVGRQSTTVTSLSHELLAGECDGATHFVRSASLGAFSMATGSKGKAAVTAELFGFGGGASSDSDRAALNADGNLESCMSSDPSSPMPPSECQAPVRIELVPIGGEAKAAAAEGETKSTAVENPCMPGYVYADGMCMRPSAERAHLCDPDDQADCQAQCDKGDAESCFNLGRILEAKDGPAEAPLNQACEADIVEACTLLGEILWYAADPDEDPNADQLINRAFTLVNKGCEGGDGYGCELAGDIFSDSSLPSYDESRAYVLYTRSCDLGSGIGCSYAAERLFKGMGVGKDVGKGLELLLRSCQAGSWDECGEIGGILNNAKYGLPRDVATAAKYFGVACLGEVGWCEMAGDVATQAGETESARRWYERDCGEDPDSDSCKKI
jgi:uncharacterized protein